MYPQVKHNIHLRASSHADQFVDGCNREKEETHILQTWVIIVKRRIVLLPAGNTEFDQVVSAKPGIGDIVLFLQEIQNGQCLMLKTCAEPFRQLRDSADPFARSNQIGDSFYPAVGGAEVGIGAERHVIKKIGTSACTDVPIFHKAADELAVDAASWVVHNLFDF